MATEFKLVASDTNEFGRAVALSGDYAIVGAREKSGFPGSAYVFVKNGTGWAKQAKLSGSVKQETDDFGFAVAIEGDYAIVGARYTVGPPYGRAYVFHRNGSDWVEECALVPIDPMAPWNYLRSIALSGDLALVGTDAALHFFQRIGSTWTEQPKFMSLYPVSLSGNYLVTRNSLAYVFQRNGTTWQQQAVLTASDDFDGGWVSISGNYIIVGAPHVTTYTVQGAVKGAAYVFERSGSAWIQRARLEPDAAIPLSEFGSWVAISGDYAVVGAPEDFEAAGCTGAAYIFQRKGTAWLRAEKIIASDAADGDLFGMPVAIDGSVVGGLAIVGAPEKDGKKGAAYILSDFPAVIGDLPDLSKYAIYAKILFGVTGDGGGLIWLPGKGPVPVGPDPLKAWSMLSPTKRDVLVGVALSEMANLISDGNMRQEVRTAGLKLAKQAASQLRIPDGDQSA